MDEPWFTTHVSDDVGARRHRTVPQKDRLPLLRLARPGVSGRRCVSGCGCDAGRLRGESTFHYAELGHLPVVVRPHF